MKVVLFFISIILLVSCVSNTESTPQVKKYGLGWDTARKRIGLPQIKEKLELNLFGFECLDVYTDCASFIASDNLKKPRYDLKKVFWDSAGICLERNYFLGPQNEVLQIFYGYKQFSDWEKIGFGYGFTNAQRIVADSFNKAQADSVLLAWKIAYP